MTEEETNQLLNPSIASQSTTISSSSRVTATGIITTSTSNTEWAVPNNQPIGNIVIEENKLPSEETKMLNLSERIIPPDSIIVSVYNYGNQFIMKDLMNVEDINYHRFSAEGHYNCQPYIYFDKKMNCLNVNSESFKEKASNSFNFIDGRALPIHVDEYYYPFSINPSRYLVLNKVALIASKGKDLSVVMREGFTDDQMSEVHKQFEAKFKQVEDAISKIRPVVSSMYKEEDYDIFTRFTIDNKNVGKFVMFSIHVIHHDITITNSIEQCHYIGDLQVIYEGNFRKQMNIYRKLLGRRLTFTVSDLIAGYHHSHLPASRSYLKESPQSFCLGSENHMFSYARNGSDDDDDYSWNGSDKINELELEGILLATNDYVKWESLEGGPFMKMENIANGRRNTVVDLNTNYITRHYINYATSEAAYNLLAKHVQDISDCFSLKMVKDHPRFVLNKDLLYDNVHYNIPKKEIYAFYDLYTSDSTRIGYIPESRGFYVMGDLLSPEQMRTEAKKDIRYSYPSYINGEYIETSITDLDEKKDELVANNITLHPSALVFAANRILYKLNKELENECRENR